MIWRPFDKLSEESSRSSRRIGTTSRKSLPNAFGIPTTFICDKSRDEDIPIKESDRTNGITTKTFVVSADFVPRRRGSTRDLSNHGPTFMSEPLSGLDRNHGPTFMSEPLYEQLRINSLHRYQRVMESRKSCLRLDSSTGLGDSLMTRC